MHLSLDRHRDNENDDSDENDESNERDETVKNESLESGRDLHKIPFRNLIENSYTFCSIQNDMVVYLMIL